MPRVYLSRKVCLLTMGLMLLITIVLIVFLGNIVKSAPPPIGYRAKDDKSTLELLHVVFRHGPRTPADTYPNDPHVNHTFYPYGWGHLTNSGKRELFNMGTWLRGRYSTFLDSYYQPDLVHAQATGVSRTHMSLETVLAGLFPPKNTPMEWNSKLNWQPIPIFSQPLQEDTLLLVRTACPRYFEALQETLNSEAVKEEIKPFRRMLAELTQLTGINMTEPEDVQSLYLTLLAEEEYGLQLPTWTKAYYPEMMQFLAEQSYVYNVWTREMQKIKAGPFLSKMFNEMRNKAADKLSPKSRKLFIYSGHDSTIANIMSALQIWKRQMVRYSALIIFELHKNKTTEQHYVETYFSNNPKEEIQKLVIPGCEFQCPLETFVELNKDVVIEGTRDLKRCEAKNEAFTEPPLRGP